MVMRTVLLCQRLLKTSIGSKIVRVYKSSHASEVNVPLFGKLLLNANSPVRLRALNPQQFPDNDKIRVFGSPKPKVSIDGLIVSVDLPTKTKDAFELEVPFQYDVGVVHRGDGDTIIENLENRKIDVQNHDNSIQMRNIKASVISATAKQDIRAAKHLQGNISMKSDQGDIITDRIQGTDVNIHCPHGKVDIQSLYCQNCSIIGEHSTVRTGPTKGNISVSVEEEGTVEIGDINGSMEVRMRCGNVVAHVSMRSNIDIDLAEGDILLTVTPSCQLIFDVSAPEINVDEKLPVADGSTMELPDGLRFTGSLNGEEEAVCRLQTREGKVTVTSKMWYETLGIE